MLARCSPHSVVKAVDASGNCVVSSIVDALDSDGSGDVDIDELVAAWRAWFGPALNPVRCLIIVDVQNDFIDGPLALRGCPAQQDGAAVVPVINSMRESVAWDVVVVSLDWHPKEHCALLC